MISSIHLFPLTLIPDVIPHIILPTILLSVLFSHILRSLTRLALLEISSLRQASSTLLYATALGLWDVSVVSAAAGVRAVLGCAAWELVGDALVDSGFVGWDGVLVYMLNVYGVLGGGGGCT